MKNRSQVTLDIKETLANELIDAFLSDGSNTRASAARDCGVSLTTSGKMANLLISLGYFCERLKVPEVTLGRRCRHLMLSSSVSTIVIDMSSPIYSLNVIEGEHKLIYSKAYEYDPTLDFESNFTVFLSRTGMGMPYKKVSTTQICVILSDDGTKTDIQAYLPAEIDRPRIEEILNSAFGRSPLIFINEKEAFGAAIRYGINNSKDCSICYIRTDAPASLLFYSKGESYSCRLGKLLTENGAIDKVTNQVLTRDERDELIARLVNFADVAFSPELILLSSREYDIDDTTVRSVRYRLASMGVGYPIIKLCSRDGDLRILGAARATVSAFIKLRVSKRLNANK